MAAAKSNTSPSDAQEKAASSDANTATAATKAAPETAETTSVTLKAPPKPPPTDSEEEARIKAAAEPSCEDSEQSDHYVLAKTLLNAGDFEAALTATEEGLEQTRAVIMAVSGKTEPEDPYISFHEAMAPFHYLYGTTLLYSIEESSDSQAMTTAAAAGGENPESGEEEADDQQIAWENLEAARGILERMVATSSSNEKLKLDLAQVFLRLGDLQRLNGRYETAVQDYSSCLQLRQDNSLLGPYDRKIADVHYNLGLNYMMLVAEVKSRSDQEPSPEDPPPMDPAKSEALRAEYRAKSFQHYFACSKSLCGQIAFLCNVDPAALLAKAEKNVTNFKSTGEDDDNGSTEHPKVVGLKLKTLRDNITSLTAPQEHQELVSDLCQLLDEIQETIDEAENSEEGVKQVSDMKAEISAAAAGEDAGFAGAASGATTTVGFGAAAATGETATTTVGFGAAATEGSSATTTTGFGSAVAAESAAQPVMMVKKKKKRPAAEEDSKMPAQEDPSKRSKTE